MLSPTLPLVRWPLNRGFGMFGSSRKWLSSYPDKVCTCMSTNCCAVARPVRCLSHEHVSLRCGIALEVRGMGVFVKRYALVCQLLGQVAIINPDIQTICWRDGGTEVY